MLLKKISQLVLDAASATGELAANHAGASKKVTEQSVADLARMKHALVNGGAAGNITVAAIKVGDDLTEVAEHVYTAGVVTDIVDLTSEFTINADGKINNATHTDTTGNKLWVRWTKRTA